MGEGNGLATVARHGIGRHSHVRRTPMPPHVTLPAFDDVIAEGVADGVAVIRRRTRRLLVGALSVLLAAALAVGGTCGFLAVHGQDVRERRSEYSACSTAVARMSGLWSKATRQRRIAQQAVARMDSSYDLETLIPLAQSDPPTPPTLSCATDPAKTARRAAKASTALEAWLKPLESALTPIGSTD